MQKLLLSTMESILEGHPTTIEEDTELLKEQMDWPSECAILYRRNEKKSLKWLIESSKTIISIMGMPLEQARQALTPLPQDLVLIKNYLEQGILHLIEY